MDEFDRIIMEFMTETVSAPNVMIVNDTPASYDPATGTVASNPTSTPAYGILMDLTLQSNGASLKYGTMIQQGDKELYLMPPKPLPQLVQGKTKINVAGAVWNIVTLKEVNPTGLNPVLYTLYLRR